MQVDPRDLGSAIEAPAYRDDLPLRQWSRNQEYCTCIHSSEYFNFLDPCNTVLRSAQRGCVTWAGHCVRTLARRFDRVDVARCTSRSASRSDGFLQPASRRSCCGRPDRWGNPGKSRGVQHLAGAMPWHRSPRADEESKTGLTRPQWTEDAHTDGEKTAVPRAKRRPSVPPPTAA